MNGVLGEANASAFASIDARAAVFFHFDVLRIFEIERFLFDPLGPRNWEAL
jgi:hypothetical protein